MLELIWRFDVAPLDDESILRPLMGALEDLPGFTPAHYDLNQKEQWRPFDLDRAVVDALTQRTQLVRLVDADRTQQVLVALGKHDEQPTAIARLDGAQDPKPHVARWSNLYDALPLRATVVTSADWRRALADAELAPDRTGDLLGMALGWRRGAEPNGLEQFDAESSGQTPVRLAREANHLVLWLAEEPAVEDARHRRDLERVARLLARSAG